MTTSWLNLGETKPADTPTDISSVAVAVLDEFDISYTGSGGGSLKNVDLKRVDAMSAIKASLLESMSESSGSFEEIIVNSSGAVEFITVGLNSANLNPYYTVESSKSTPKNVGVMVTGGKPKTVRIMSDWVDLIGENVDGCYKWDATNLSSQCLDPGFRTSVVITYKNPHLENIGSRSWQNGITDLFEVSSPYESIIGFVWDINPGDRVKPTTDIRMQNQTSLPILVSPTTDYSIGDTANFPNLGTLQRRGVVDPQTSECWSSEGDPVSCTEAVKIDLSPYNFITRDTEHGIEVNRLAGVSNIFVVGLPLSYCFGKPKKGESKNPPTEDNTELFVSSSPSSGVRKLYKLNEGVDYAIGYDESDLDSNPCIKFANNSRHNDLAKFGTGVSFKIDPLDTALAEIFDNTLDGLGSILPLSVEGIMIEQLWAQIDVNTPSFIVQDPTGIAADVAKDLTVQLAALSVINDPPPIAFNGDIIDQSDAVVDNDPTTQQDFTETEMEKALNSMSTGRTLSLNLASLDENGTKQLSQNLYDLLQEDDGYSYTHICPPSDDPEIGSRGPRGGIINSIEYSYSDQGSYLITVTEGPEFSGDVGGIGGGLYTKKVETLSEQGTIVQDYGNHVNYKVRVDGIGTIEAINTYAGVLTTRDRVNITIHNNEVED